MVKAGARHDPLLRRPFSVFEILRDDARRADRHLAPQQAHRRRHRRCSTTREPGTRVAVPRSARPAVHLVDPPAEAWMVAGGVGLAPFATLAEALRARGTPTTLFYGARRAAELFYSTVRAARRRAGADHRGRQPRRTRAASPRRSTARWPRAPARQPRHDLRLRPGRRCCARPRSWRERHGRPCEVSVEQVMGCGLGGCYSCVVPPMRGGERAALRPLVPRRTGVRRRAGSCGRRWRTDMDLSVSIGSLRLKNPLIAASGCFGYGVEYADVVDLSSLGGVAVKGLFLARARRPPAAAHRRNAGRHAERDRPAGHRRAPLRRREAAGAARRAARR